MGKPDDGGLFLFGYGSLIWRPGFRYVEAHDGYIVGWARRFWQLSTDHRGVVGAPGRVVTLNPEVGRCWGRVYRVAPDAADRILARVDHRERGGYSRQEVTVHTHGGEIQATTYVATPQNPNFAGPAPLIEVARRVRNAVGPSGPNLEYVLRLHEALVEMGGVDEELAALVHLLSSNGLQ